MSSAAVGVVAGISYAVGSFLIFILGSSYYSLFRTNRSVSFRLSLIAVAAVPAGFLLPSGLNPAYGLLALAFLAAATANALGAAVGAHLHAPLRIRIDSLKGVALAKALEAATVVAAILVLLFAADVPIRLVFLSLGKLRLGVGIGVAGFAGFALVAWRQGRRLGIDAAAVRRLLPWILTFCLANAFMEELWFRALFFGALATLAGPVAAIVLTAGIFALIHIGAPYVAKGDRIWFLSLLFLLGLAWGACLKVTGSIIASTLFHAGADLMIVNGLVRALHGEKAAGTAEV